ncbi:hypothetical protein LT330_010026 [Penicillium expansum]|nr:hypothetical protein LT330_010026 [Penicillium expansum]
MWNWLKPKPQEIGLFEAVLIGDAWKVEHLLSNQCNTSIADNSGMTVLHWAALRGDNKVVSLLLQNDTSLTARTDHHGRVAMHCAAENGHLEAVKLIGSTGIKASDSIGRTALHWAAENGHLDVVTFLLKKGANASALDSFEETPVHKAASRGHESVVQLLLRHTVEINKPDHNGYTALHRAAEGKNGKVALLLLENKGVDFDAKTAAGKEVCLAAKATANDKARDAAALDHRLSRRSAVALLLKWMTHKEIEGDFEKVLVSISKEQSPRFLPTFYDQASEFLLWAVIHNIIGVVDRLLAQGISPNRKERYPKPVLQHAAKRGYCDMVQLLLVRGAQVNAGLDASSKETAFMHAAENGHLDVMRLLIDGGADIEAELAYDGKSAFERASTYGHTSIVQFLLEQSTHRNITISLQKREFAFGCAIRNGHYDVVKVFLDGGLTKADVFDQVRSSLASAARRGDLNMFQLLEKYELGLGDDGYEALGFAIGKGHRDLVKHILGGFTKVRISSDVDVGLQVAAGRGDLEMFKLLEEYGFGLSSKGKGPALMHAIGNGHRDVVKRLLDGGIAEADIVSAVNVGLGVGARLGDLKMFEFLAEYGFGIRGTEEAFALRNAIGHGHCNLVKFLLDGELAETDVVSKVKEGLYYAAFRGALEMFELLEGCGFEVRSSTYLIEAAQKNSLPLVRFLMDHDKVNINATGTEFSMTPLQFAAQHGNIAMINFLLDEGADINAPVGKNVSRYGSTPRTRCAIDLAREQDHLEAVRLLGERGAKRYNPTEDE